MESRGHVSQRPSPYPCGSCWSGSAEAGAEDEAVFVNGKVAGYESPAARCAAFATLERGSDTEGGRFRKGGHPEVP